MIDTSFNQNNAALFDFELNSSPSFILKLLSLLIISQKEKSKLTPQIIEYYVDNEFLRNMDKSTKLFFF